MRHARRIAAALTLALVAALGCEQGEDVDDADLDDVEVRDTVVIEDEGDLEEGVEATGGAIEEGAEEVGEAVQDAGDEIEDAVDESN